jgi:hypothetical protein
MSANIQFSFELRRVCERQKPGVLAAAGLSPIKTPTAAPGAVPLFPYKTACH